MSNVRRAPMSTPDQDAERSVAAEPTRDIEGAIARFAPRYTAELRALSGEFSDRARTPAAGTDGGAPPAPTGLSPPAPAGRLQRWDDRLAAPRPALLAAVALLVLLPGLFALAGRWLPDDRGLAAPAPTATP
ncbi:MAG TPA: hypothetical protein VFW96_25880, partial [Thermomicrobiales bacterium]|nr:hypothetical protein [Thermomicrobiales bacterium]